MSALRKDMAGNLNAIVQFNILFSQSYTAMLYNSFHPNISIEILYTLLYTFPLVLTRRIGLTIKASLVGDHFLYSQDLYM